MNFCSSENSWEPIENLNCFKLIEKFEEKLKSSTGNGFDQGLKVEEILGATLIDGQLSYLIKWKGSNNNEYVSSKVANQMCPQKVIDFFERNSIFNKKL